MRKFRNRLISALLAMLLAVNPLCINMISVYAESSAEAKTGAVSQEGETSTSDSSSGKSERSDKANGKSDKREERTDKADESGEKVNKANESVEKSDKADENADKSEGQSDNTDESADNSGERSDKTEESTDRSGERSDKAGDTVERPDKTVRDSDKSGERSVKGGVREKENGRKHNKTVEENENSEEVDEAHETEDIEEEFGEAETIDKETVTDTPKTFDSIDVDLDEEDDSVVIVKLLPLEQDEFIFDEKPSQEELDDILPEYLCAVAVEDEDEEEDEDLQIIIHLPVSWECEDDYFETQLDSYIFDACPEWDEDAYELDDGEELPIITVVITDDMVILTKTVNDVEVTITAPKGVFPTNAKLSVEKITVKERIENAADAIAQYNSVEGEESSDIDLFDIRIYDTDEEEIKPDGMIKVSFRYTDSSDFFGESAITIYQFEDDETTNVEKVDAEQNEDTLECEVEYCSVFAIISDIEYLADDLYELRFEGDAPKYPNDGFKLYTRNPSDYDGQVYLETPEGMFAGIISVERGTTIIHDFTDDNSKAMFLTTVGDYEFYMIVNGEKVASLTFTIIEKPTLTIAFTEDIESNANFYKAYQAKDPSQPFDLSSEYFDIIESSGLDTDGLILTNVTYTRESGEDPGKYKILTMSSSECENITIVDNEYCYFTINKPSATSGISKTIKVFADGYARSISISGYYSFSSDKTPTGAKVREMSDEALAYFTTPPVMSGFNLNFTLKESDKAFTVDIPIELENEKYSYGTGLTLTIQGEPRVHVESHTEEEIKNYYNTNSFSTSKSDTWSVTPNISKEIPGTLTAATRENSLNALNFIRYIAGLEEVGYSEDYEVYAQAGSSLMSAANNMNHYPSKPSGVSDSFYELGIKGTSESNIAFSSPSKNLAWHVLYGWMNDGDEDNIDSVGHRRWCLDPNMHETAFGHTGEYTTMYVWDAPNNYSSNEYILDFIPWPAQEMPIDYFSGPWCVSLGKNNYALTTSSGNDITVTMECNGKTYTVDSSNKNASGKYFNFTGVTSYSGYGPVIIFEPNVTFKAGDEVKVTITGLKDSYGADTPITYTVNFFAMSTSSSSSGGSSGGSSGRSSGGGSGGGGGGGGSSSGSGTVVGSTGTTGPSGTSSGSLPDYVVDGTWLNLFMNIWEFMDADSNLYVNKWAAIYNPYADTSIGQQAYDWFCFDENGYMRYGWYQDTEGNLYYLNPVTDGTLGAMFTGWHWIADDTGTEYCYYFNPNSDGYRGKLLTDTVVDGYTLDGQGRWTVDGVPQTSITAVATQ